MINPKDVEDLLEKKGLNNALNWFQKLPLEKQQLILKTFKKVFESNTPPSINDLLIIKKFYDAEGIDRLHIEANKDREEWKRAFNKLADFFPSPKQWHEYEEEKNRYPYLDYKSKGFETVYDYLDSKKVIPSPNIDSNALKKTEKNHPFFDEFNRFSKPEEQYIQMAEALIELYPFRKDIISLLATLNKKQNVRNSNDKEIDTKINKLVSRYSKNPNVKYSENEILFILKKAEELKHQEIISAVIRNIQEHPECPESIKDKKPFNASNKHAKRQRCLIEFFDTETGNKRKKN